MLNRDIRAYYNESDPYAAQWIRNLIRAELITPGYVDERDIREVRPSDVVGYNCVHWFAGIAVWDYALNQAQWGENEVWTGSCPCQPFSGAGKRKGFSDERHLWPVWFDLIAKRRPCIILGEQVASPDGYAWFDHVQADMESLGYACGAVVTPAAGYGAPHERHRIYWMAYAHDARSQGWGKRRNSAGGMAKSESQQSYGGGNARRGRGEPSNCGGASGLDNAACVGHRSDQMESIAGRRECTARPADGAYAAGESAARPVNGFWQDADWLLCRDGKWRPVEPGTFPLAHGTTARVGRLRAYGNAIVATQAAEFIKTVMEIVDA